ncbi:cocaine esterase-like [Spinachia spinachia]
MMMMYFRSKPIFVFLTSAFVLGVAAELHAPEVQTKLGTLRGQYVSVKGKETGVHAYLAVPFAKPPIGPALRLAPPQPVEGWEGVRDATQQPPMCIQMRQVSLDMIDQYRTMLVDLPDISEDCLYLNIYTPAKKALGPEIPVMVWIHGGGFTFGAASVYDGSALAAYQDVVVVVIQYRLGFLGFLSTGDEHMSGNFGMLDQVEALRWTQQHIHNFGGNPDLVTIFGESAGGISVSLLLLSPLSEGLFHNAIAESGTAAMEPLIENDPVSLMKVVANKTGCSLESTEKIAGCIRNLNLDTVLSIVQDATVRYLLNVDGVFLTKPVDELHRTRELLTIPFMTGFNSDEGGWLLCRFFAPPNWTEGMEREQFESLLLMFYPDPKDSFFRDLITEEYIGKGEDRLKNRARFTKFIGDMIFNVPAIETANTHRDAGAPVYLYEYRHAPTFLRPTRPSFVGSDHGDEIFAVFGFCFTTTHVKLSVACDEEEEQLNRIMMSYWGNFARTGCPNGDGLVHWPKYGAEEAYLSIDAKEQATGHHPKKDELVFLTQTLPEKSREYKEKLERHEL